MDIRALARSFFSYATGRNASDLYPQTVRAKWTQMLIGFGPLLQRFSGAPHTILALAEAGLGAAIVPSTMRINSRKLYPAPLYYDGAPLQIVASVSWLRRRHMPAYKTGFIEEFINAAEQQLSLD